MRLRLLFIIIIALFFSACSMKEISPGAQITAPHRGILKKYHTFYVAPIRVYALENNTLTLVDEPEVAEEFHTKMVSQLGRKASMFSQPSAGVAVIYVSVTDAAVPQIIHQLKPGLVIPNADKGGAIIEARFIDSVTHRDLLTYRDSQTGVGESVFAGFDRWSSVRNALDLWTAELAEVSNF